MEEKIDKPKEEKKKRKQKSIQNTNKSCRTCYTTHRKCDGKRPCSACKQRQLVCQDNPSKRVKQNFLKCGACGIQFLCTSNFCTNCGVKNESVIECSQLEKEIEQLEKRNAEIRLQLEELAEKRKIVKKTFPQKKNFRRRKITHFPQIINLSAQSNFSLFSTT